MCMEHLMQMFMPKMLLIKPKRKLRNKHTSRAKRVMSSFIRNYCLRCFKRFVNLFGVSISRLLYIIYFLILLFCCMHFFRIILFDKSQQFDFVLFSMDVLFVIESRLNSSSKRKKNHHTNKVCALKLSELYMRSVLSTEKKVIPDFPSVLTVMTISVW